MAVIGAGAAGLSAAWRLLAAGHEVVVHEQRATPGGLLRTAEHNGVCADQAVQLLSSAYGETRRLAADAGVGDGLVPAAGHDAFWRKGRAHGITYGSVSSMAASGALPTLLKLKLAAKYVPWLSTRGARLDVNDLAGTAATEDGESIAAWGARELGEDFVEYLAYPLLAAYYGTPPESASAALYHALAREGMQVSLFALRGGAGAFARALAASIERAGGRLVLNETVQEVVPGSPGVRLRTSAGDATYDRAVVATPPTTAAALLAGTDAAAWLEAARTRPAVSVTLWLNRRVNVAWFGISYPRVERPGQVAAAACVQGTKLEFAADAVGDAVVVFPAPAYLDGDPGDESLRRDVLAAVEPGLPGIGQAVSDVEVTRLDGGFRTFAPGWIRRLAQQPPPLPPGIALAGDYLVAPTVEGAVRSGVRAAEQVQRST